MLRPARLWVLPADMAAVSRTHTSAPRGHPERRTDKCQCFPVVVKVLIHRTVFLIYGSQKPALTQMGKKLYQKKNEDMNKSKMNPELRLGQEIHSLEKSHKPGFPHSSTEARRTYKHSRYSWGHR